MTTESHLLPSSFPARNILDSPSPYINCPDYKDSSSTSLSGDSGYNESLQSTICDHTDTNYEVLDPRSLTQVHEDSENVDPTLPFSPIEIEKYPLLMNRKEVNGIFIDFYETPKVPKKSVPLRRRLLISKTSSGNVECLDTLNSTIGNHEKGICLQQISFEAHITNTSLHSPRNVDCKPISSSTLRTEESIASCQKRRLAFSQQRTSTLEDPKSENNLMTEVEYLSPVKYNNYSETTDGILMNFDECTCPKLFNTPISCKFNLEKSEDEFLTPVSNLAADLNFHLSNIITPPAVQVCDLDFSETEDSAFHSLDKSQDYSADCENSFQELFQKQRDTPKTLLIRSRPRKVERNRRLSTLRERGSQSEAEEEHNETEIITSEYKLKVLRSSVTEDSEYDVNEEDGENSVLRLEDLSGTPALQIVHEMIVRSKRKRPEQATVQILLGHAEGAETSEMEDILSRLIGKKMGIEKIDILAELKCRNLKHVLAIVLDASTVESICSIWEVSRIWREIVVQDKHANERRKLYLEQLKTETEGHLLRAEDAATRLNLLSRSALKSVQAQTNSIYHTPSSCKEILMPKRCHSVPHLSSKQEEYLKVAKTLFSDEAIKPCPRCQYPAKYQPLKKRGLCCQKDCAFDFCILCLCTFHGSKECNSGSVKRQSKKEALPGSAQSKRNLKRL
uniref:F-box only protein 43 n=1 Tax=Geotrypetes seraphini TaxID=260995 RepID=A0A6P8PKG2_GEOSA|nr:F-box only protein 43 [Geotrypetes seraphini]XP_033789030.1 F-box only protein 43 [Geotrypetes seraphini]XP_033789031.1 F-box only protein 43 [Geotrypetes seraphini]XP_033789032.1 F-box only protein 43 [Geotrypetes seraphini]XP_033789033.1 F-box only protein 43 [Geotrypetes seraphini]